MPSEPATPEPISVDEFAVMQRLAALHKRTGAIYAGDPASGRIDRIRDGIPKRAPIVHVPVRQEQIASPGEQGRQGRRASTSSRGSPNDPDLPPPPVETWHGVAAASVRMQTRLARRRAKWAAA
jgi:hypothetical protein